MTPSDDTRARAPRPEPQRCPYCHDAIATAEAATCVGCETAHHLDCIADHGGCAVAGCQSRDMRWRELAILPEDIPTLRLDPAEEAEERRRDAAWERGEDASQRRPVFAMAVVTLITLPLLGTSAILILSEQPLQLGLGLALGIATSWLTVWGLGPRPPRPASSVSLWHDVMGQTGFDPITGTGPPPRLPAADDEEPTL